MKKTVGQNDQQIKEDAAADAIYSITDNPNTPPEVKKFLLDYLFEKTGISVEFSEVETKQGEAETTADEQTDQRTYFSDIQLTTAQVVELSEWIITQTRGIFSADAEDDKPKQALLILLSAITYEDDTTKRESLLLEVMRTVFGYSAACDVAENDFITNGFRAFSSGEWNSQIEESEVKN